jgi:hypothetical protein
VEAGNHRQIDAPVSRRRAQQQIGRVGIR